MKEDEITAVIRKIKLTPDIDYQALIFIYLDISSALFTHESIALWIELLNPVFLNHIRLQ